MCKHTFAPLCERGFSPPFFFSLFSFLFFLFGPVRETLVCEVNLEGYLPPSDKLLILRTQKGTDLCFSIILIHVCMLKTVCSTKDWKVVLFFFIHVLMFVWICVLELASLWFILGYKFLEDRNCYSQINFVYLPAWVYVYTKA